MKAVEGILAKFEVKKRDGMAQLIGEWLFSQK